MSNDTEMTTLVDKTELRNRFAPQEKEPLQTEQATEEVGTGLANQQIQETQKTQKTQKTQETQETQEEEEKETPAESSEEEKEAADTPSDEDAQTSLPKDKYGREYVEVNGKRYYAPNIVHEDAYGRKYVRIQDETYYAEETSWNTPFPVALSFSLILAINALNIGYALAHLYVC